MATVRITEFKPIKIDEKSINKLNEALEKCNGKAITHALTSANELLSLAAIYEKHVIKVLGSKRHIPGAIFQHTSGDQVPNSYKHPRIATFVEVQRRAQDWYLIGACQKNINQNPGDDVLILTEAQDKAAIANTRTQYVIAKEQ